jgi:hypothetical protein
MDNSVASFVRLKDTTNIIAAYVPIDVKSNKTVSRQLYAAAWDLLRQAI